ncbi:MAG: porin [Salaquimonas sp.]|nr:porin [Salaquimonas sp.]
MPACALAAAGCLVSMGATMQANAQELRVGTDTSYIEVYGQLDKAFLYYDDGQQQKFYPLVDNDSSSSRFGVRAYQLRDNGVAIGANAEFEWEPYSTDYVNLLTAHDVDIADLSLRKAEIYLSHDAFGKLWVGRGSMASDNTSEVDLSGTTLAGYASVGDIAGAQLFRLTNGTLSGIEIYDAFSDLDGLGRKTRVRYDTPNFDGFSFGTSVDINGDWDAALNYEKELGDFSVAAAAAYSYNQNNSAGLTNGSLSVLHNPTGISVTLAAGDTPHESGMPEFVYGKLGYQAQWFQYGKTYFSIDAYSGHYFNTSGSESKSYGFAMVQDVDDWRTQYYLGVRQYQYDDPGASYENGLAVILGARVKF